MIPGPIVLEGQTDHSGVQVSLDGADVTVYTDSLGRYDLGEVSGSYIMTVRYPYFVEKSLRVSIVDGKTDDSEQIMLERAFQFSVLPEDTTISLGDGTDPFFVDLLGFRRRLQNIAGDPVTLTASHGPIEFWAVEPIGFEWPVIPDSLINSNRLETYCYDHYGWFGSDDTITWFERPTEPGEVQVSPAPGRVLRGCLLTGNYYLFAAPSDEWNFREYFDAAFFWQPSTEGQPYNPLNRTLLKKTELFQPAIVQIIN